MALKLINTENLDTLADKMKARTGTEGKLVFPEGFNNEVEKMVARNALTLIVDRQATEVTAEQLQGITSIGMYAFAYMRELKTLILPEGVTRLETSAIRACDTLNKLILPSTLEYIGDYSIYACTHLKEFKIPAKVKTILDSGIRQLTRLERVDMTDYGESESFPTLGGTNTFSGCGNIYKIVVPYGRRGEIIEMTNWSTFADRIYSEAVDLLLGTWNFKNCPSAPQPSLYTYNIKFINGNKNVFTQLGIEIADTPDGTYYYMYFYNENGTRLVAYDDSQGGWTLDAHKNISIIAVKDTPEKVEELYDIFMNSGVSKIGNVETWEFKENFLSQFEGDYNITFECSGIVYDKMSLTISSGVMYINYCTYMGDVAYVYEGNLWNSTQYSTITIISTEGETEERLQAFYTWLEANATKK